MSRLSIRSTWSTVSKPVANEAPPTFCVGLSGVRSEGCSSSIWLSRRMMRSYSPSLIVGASFTWYANCAAAACSARSAHSWWTWVGTSSVTGVWPLLSLTRSSCQPPPTPTRA